MRPESKRSDKYDDVKQRLLEASNAIFADKRKKTANK
ncbi:Protein of unknown function [Lactobacillus pasteurii DSM 23907 = CRBIP 24.76]|uniref:Uncharacterized protein n=1 Tax=Lactobacillus pasteurii DSM 23907 = CRBIP 24.76 TaxID=1423790 RepID=I7JY81_9LACO|nr:Protein of unknown function [Lactobacillus pasteurii DSM 23907 = CRBIP 24.76]